MSSEKNAYLVNLSVKSAKSTVQKVVWHAEAVDKADGVGADLLLHQVHNGLAHHRHMLGVNITRGQELAGLLVDLMKGKQIRQVSHGGLGSWGQLCNCDSLRLGHIAANSQDKVLNEDQLTMGD